MGIPTARVKIACFMICSVLAGFAGMIQVLRLGSPLPSIGEGMELQAVAAAVIGGTSLAGGVGTIFGGIIGAALIRVIDNGMVCRRVDANWFKFAIGCADHLCGRRQRMAAQSAQAHQGGELRHERRRSSRSRTCTNGIRASTRSRASASTSRRRGVGLVGDNGAGKSTLIKILSGVHRPDEGEILVEGKPVRIRNPQRRDELGIETIYQYNSMVPTMTIARNVFIGREPLNWSLFGIGMLDQKRMREKASRRSPMSTCICARPMRWSANSPAASGRASPSPAPCISSRR